MRPGGYVVSPHVAHGAIWVWDPWCRPCVFYQMRVASHQVVIGRQLCTLFDPNSNSDWNKSAETMQKSVNLDLTNICTRCTYANLWVGWNCSKCTVRCYSTVVTRYFRCHLRQHHNVDQSHLPYPSCTVPNGSLESSKIFKNSSFCYPQTIASSLHEFPVLCTWVWAA